MSAPALPEDIIDSHHHWFDPANNSFQGSVKKRSRSQHSLCLSALPIYNISLNETLRMYTHTADRFIPSYATL